MSQRLLGNLQEGLLFVISAPAGTGKTTLVTKLIEEFPDHMIQSISYTTRAPRNDEKDGVHYHFVSKTLFEKKISAHDFLEYVKLYDNYYGTSASWVRDQQKSGKHVVLVIDTQGALQLMGKLEATFIFIKPPTLKHLRDRMLNRNTESDKDLQCRLSTAEEEIKMAGFYDYQFENDSLEIAYEVLRSIIISEEHRVGLRLKEFN